MSSWRYYAAHFCRYVYATTFASDLVGTRLMVCQTLELWVPFLEVEKNEFCQKILRARMADGLLHKAEIHEDVCSYNAATSGAQGCGGGFPCQARVGCFQRIVTSTRSSLSQTCHFPNCLEQSWILFMSCGQGVSTAGKQHGLSDPRTKLVHPIFRVFDTLPRDHRCHRAI